MSQRLGYTAFLRPVAEGFERLAGTGEPTDVDVNNTPAGFIYRIERASALLSEASGGGGGGTWGSITGTLSAQTDLQAALDGKQAAGAYLVAADLAPYLTSAAATAAYQPLDAVLTATTASFTTAKDTKLTGIATGATVNSSDATLLARANHTGTQLAATISDFVSAVLVNATAVTGLLGTQSVAAFKTGLSLAKADVGLGNVDNTSDANKPVSTAQATAIGLKLDASAVSAYGLTLIDDANAATARTTLGGTTVGSNLFTLTNPGAISFLRVNADNTVTPQTAANFRTDLGLVVGTNVQAYSANLTTYAGIAPSANVQTILGAADYAAIRTALSLTALATTTPGTGVAAALAVNVGTAGSVVVNGGALGTPSSGTLTNCTFPTLNQNTTGSAATLTTSRNFSISGGGITAAAQGFNGSAAVVLSASVDAGHITLARMADIATARLIGRVTAATGVPEALTGTQATTLLDVATGSLKGLMSSADFTKLSGIATGATANDTDANLKARANHTGTQAISTILAAASARLFGRITASGGAGEELTGAQATTLLDVMGAASAGAGGAKGLTPASAAGDQGKFLRGDATWVTIPGGGDMLAANNLSDVASAATARTNLGVQPTNDPTFTGTLNAASAVINTANIGVSYYDTPGTIATFRDSGAGFATQARLGFGTAVLYHDAAANQFRNLAGTTVYGQIDSGGLKLPDTDASHMLALLPGSNLTANRTLTIATGDADRTLTMTGNASIAGTNTGDQTSIVGITGTLAQFNTAITDAELPLVMNVHYNANGAAQGATIADYFTSTLSLEAASTYEITCHAYFLKTTAGTVIWTWTFSNAPTVASSRNQSTPITGFTTSTITGAEVFAEATAEAVAAMAHAASGSLTTAVRHSVMFTLLVRTNLATTLQLRSTQSAGTLTPQAGSYMSARKIV